MSFSIKDYDLRDAFATEKKLLLLSGFYPRRNKSVLYIFSAFMNVIISVSQLLSMIIQLIVVRKDLSKLTECSLLLITHFTFLCKLANFCYYRNHLLVIENMLTDSVFYGHCNLHLIYFKKQTGLCEFVAKMFRLACAVCLSFYLLISYTGEEYTLPMPGWFPYNTTKYFHQTAIYQFTSISVSAYNNSSIDTLTWMLITIASAQFHILRQNLENINHSQSENVEIYFKKCIEHHLKIISLVQKIEGIFSKGIFLQFFASVAVICFTGFQIMIVPIPSIQFICLMLFFTSMMIQVAMYCWYGHDVMLTSDKIGQYFYLSNWYESNIRIKTSALILMERLKKSVKLTAGGYVTLSLTTLTAILRSSYSYFAVLQRLYKDEF